ncbi:uncharacterized protein RHOBADRAFT_55369, partial [Rhodotorula graminis WP1]
APTSRPRTHPARRDEVGRAGPGPRGPLGPVAGRPPVARRTAALQPRPARVVRPAQRLVRAPGSSPSTRRRDPVPLAVPGQHPRRLGLGRRRLGLERPDREHLGGGPGGGNGGGGPGQQAQAAQPRAQRPSSSSSSASAAIAQEGLARDPHRRREGRPAQGAQPHRGAEEPRQAPARVRRGRRRPRQVAPKGDAARAGGGAAQALVRQAVARRQGRVGGAAAARGAVARRDHAARGPQLRLVLPSLSHPVHPRSLFRFAPLSYHASSPFCNSLSFLS